MPHTDISVAREDDGRFTLRVAGREPFALDDEALASLCRAGNRFLRHLGPDVDSGPPYCLVVRVPYTDYNEDDQSTETYQTYVAFDRRDVRDAAVVAVRGELEAMGFTEDEGHKGSYAVEVTAATVSEEIFGSLDEPPVAGVAEALSKVRWRLVDERYSQDDVSASWWESFGIDADDPDVTRLGEGDFTDDRKAAVKAASGAVGDLVTWRRIGDAVENCKGIADPEAELRRLEAAFVLVANREAKLVSLLDDLRIVVAVKPYVRAIAAKPLGGGRGDEGTEADPDVRYGSYGSIVMVTPITDPALDWVDENLELESWQWMGASFSCEARMLADLVEGMQAAGLFVAEE